VEKGKRRIEKALDIQALIETKAQMRALEAFLFSAP